MFCRKCGVVVPDGSEYCYKCKVDKLIKFKAHLKFFRSIGSDLGWLLTIGFLLIIVGIAGLIIGSILNKESITENSYFVTVIAAVLVLFKMIFDGLTDKSKKSFFKVVKNFDSVEHIPLRDESCFIFIRGVYNIQNLGSVPVVRVIKGVLKVGMKINIAGVIMELKEIQLGHEYVKEVYVGQSSEDISKTKTEDVGAYFYTVEGKPAGERGITKQLLYELFNHNVELSSKDPPPKSRVFKYQLEADKILIGWAPYYPITLLDF